MQKSDQFSHARSWAHESPYGTDEDRWHDALVVALDHGFRLIAVDALEGLAVAAGGVESWTECLRLLGAAERLRDETGYRWRFAFEHRAARRARGSGNDRTTAGPASHRPNTRSWRSSPRA